MTMSPVLRIAEMGTRYAPAEILEGLGIPVQRAWLRDTWGAWSEEKRCVVVAAGLSRVQERCVLAHELEHVLAHDAGCDGTLRTVRQERRADIEAARKLVAISDLAQVAQWAPDLFAAAAELDVTERLLQVRLSDLKGEGWPWRATLKIAG
ncbi:hypothetical protein CG740_23425 [Streptomyces sp. CB01201]|uniref:ImmA/IrrE family metallo-endopeptidase n=1 Tax=Streptomyces sp. CB01201 TaxID=2020324 RepID=UPI000C278285|nr:ImmA/IrrE family metallo-endopeptidase [Streptomyces sp. CB01201]PJN00857.1 hypothetical protein CG740_23425 [Streptomyces sp. CB01201]